MTTTNDQPKRPSKRVRFAEHKETQTNTPVIKEQSSTCAPESQTEPIAKNRYGNVQQSGPLNQEQLELRIQPSPEPGKEIFYSYEYPLFEKNDEDWQYYIRMYDDEAETMSQ